MSAEFTLVNYARAYQTTRSGKQSNTPFGRKLWYIQFYDTSPSQDIDYLLFRFLIQAVMQSYRSSIIRAAG